MKMKCQHKIDHVFMFFFSLMDINEYKDINSGRNISLLGEAKKRGRKKLKMLSFLKVC